MRRARILIVDDEPGMLRAVERVLSEQHDVVGTRLSREALATATEFHPDLAIVDIRMPDLDGFELMAQLKARFPGIKFVTYDVFGNVHGPQQRAIVADVPKLLKQHGCDAVISAIGA